MAYSGVSAQNSLEHFVGFCKQCQWHVKTERLCGFKVDNEVKFRRPQDRQVSGLLAFENAASIKARLAVCILKTGTVADQPSRRNNLSLCKNCRCGISRQDGQQLRT